MEKQSASSIRKVYFLVGLLFTILFIFTAMFISKPIPVYAAGDSGTSLGQIMNLDSYSANEDDESTNDILSDKKANSRQYDTICRPLCGQTQAFWSADKRNGGGAVENRTA